jgi:molybdopterin/thiamine biosynthesis adenylyltransferase/rhodanese-related sulfurtransferase
MGQELPSLKETDNSCLMSPMAGDGNGVITAVPAYGQAQTDALPELTTKELVRYDRHLLLPQVGVDGQRKLKAASVLLIGAGGLGSPLALYLAAAGVGRIGIVDFDVVDESNMQRQILHGTKDTGCPKLQSARDRLHDINPYIHIDTFETMLRADNALEICKDYGIIIDGTDNFQTRYLVNDACVLLGKPNVYGSIFRFEGQASVFHPGAGGPCYRCLYPEPPPPGLVPSCAEGGVLGILPGIVGVIQAAEAVKLILNEGESLVGRLLLFDALKMQFRELKLRRSRQCPAEGPCTLVHGLIDYDQFCGVLPHPVQEEVAEWEITPTQLKAKLDHGEQITIIDVREPHEWQIANLAGYGARLLPLGQLPHRLNDISPMDNIVVHCKVGGRSAQAYEVLKNAGYTRIKNLQGGILAWADQVDPSMQKY